MSQQNRVQIKCSDCGKTDTVSFKPTPGKPVYCRECLSKHRVKRADSRDRTEDKPSIPNVEKQAWSRRQNNWK